MRIAMRLLVLVAMLLCVLQTEASEMARDPQATGSLKNTKAKSATKPSGVPDIGTDRSIKITQPAAHAPMTQKVAAPIIPKQVDGFGGGGGGGANVSVNGGGGGAPSDIDYLAGDEGYQAQLAALMSALQNYDADITAQQGRYNTSYDDSLRSLGWQNGIEDDPATVDVNEQAPGSWNFKDQNTAAGRSFQNQQNDFAGRGLLQSSLYAEANDNLTRSLNDQLTGMQTAKTGFLDDLSRQQTGYKQQNGAAVQQAKAEALARMAAQYGV
jgi:hypothetical protein